MQGSGTARRGGAGGGGSRDDQPKRNLPSSMAPAPKGKKIKSDNDRHQNEDLEGTAAAASSRDASHNNAAAFHKLLDGVVFALSGFVNPERGNLRTQATDMGAVYKPDWGPDCTLLVCAFANTPKFKQVQSDNGTIISKEWILECHEKRKLVPIEPYLMHPGKPWRKQQKLKQESREDRNSVARNVQKQVERPRGKSIQSEGQDLDIVQRKFSPSQIKAMAKDDLVRTVSWLQSQEEKPEADEIKEVAAQGVLTCLQDAIESLQQNLGLEKVAEQWGIVPSVVQELVALENSKDASFSKGEILDIALKCKRIYESELNKMDVSPDKGKRIENEGYNSDDTIEMTEEEIEQACKNLSGYDESSWDHFLSSCNSRKLLIVWSNSFVSYLATSPYICSYNIIGSGKNRLRTNL